VNVRIVVPVSDERGTDAQLSQHFGRAPFFVVIDLDSEGNVVGQETVANRSEHFGGVGTPPELILRLKPTALVTYGMGFKALNIFQDAGVAVLRTEANTVREVIKEYNNNELQELTEGCHHARH